MRGQAQTTRQRALIPFLALVSAGLAASCGGAEGFAEALNDSGAPGDASAIEVSDDGDAGAADGGLPIGANEGGSPAPVSLGEGGVFPEAGSCTIGSAGLLALIPGGTMAPGMACVSCHAVTGAGKLNVAGTVYPTLTEPNLCVGTSTGVQIVITDAQGNDHALSVDSSGNFYDNSLFGFPAPYKAKVVGATGSVPMLSAQTNGDCNACHTSSGAQGAAGRIVGP